MYQPTAYNSQNFQKQAHKDESSLLRKLMTKGIPFSFSDTNKFISINSIKALTPSLLEEQNVDKIDYWNHEFLCIEDVNYKMKIYLWLVALSKVVLYFATPIVIVLLAIPVIFSSDTLDYEELFSVVKDCFIYFIFPCSLIIGHWKLVQLNNKFLFSFFRESKKIFELNRQTGMVTLYKGRNKVRFSHPFIEFDCVLLSSPSHQGHLNYVLTLVHRYHNYSVGVPLSSMLGANEMVGEYGRLWNMLQRYMDVSKPMPDILILEAVRELDPTTAAYDAKHPRDPFYWRNMSDDEYLAKLAEIQQLQEQDPVYGKSINIFEDES